MKRKNAAFVKFNETGFEYLCSHSREPEDIRALTALLKSTIYTNSYGQSAISRLKAFYAEEIHGIDFKNIEGNYPRWVLAEQERIEQVECYFRGKGVSQEVLDIAFGRDNGKNKTQPSFRR